MKQAAKIIVWTFLFLAVAVAQQPPQPKTAPAAAVDKPPAIPPDVLKKFWQADDAQQRASRELEQAQAASKTASENWQAAVNALTAACGEKFQIKQDVAGQDPYCAVKPEALKPATPAK